MRSLFATIISALALGSVNAQNCGPQYGNQRCAPGLCCSQYGWCDTTPAHCDPANCLRAFSGAGSSCAVRHVLENLGGTPTSSRPPPASTSPPGSFPSVIPAIDTCGTNGGGVSCPGVGTNGYYYRCCSPAGHCGPKNPIQDAAQYCGTGCQAGFGKCNTMAIPPPPAGAPGTAGAGETCGPIVNRRCAAGLCCSGSNFCGTGPDFCGAANWCQPSWGTCSGTLGRALV
ncbi:carbohydrate-binding module family 18 protein [Sporormia fimetaria CBS 119925]|uniref:Carbohydrate-binding module family 18 protein n=1 Tax=Sporormia fimetaria CBS 119925 TaxID=1340428 RepID=A0A6A6VGU2_9PLEO|nr:carbohydrate-binding module family 18 protein [Sporormia fimetaria CBS 119925]